MSNEPRENRPPEMPAVKTTIVGGRPPGCGTPVGNIPRGLEILIKKAAVDPAFKALLLEKRSAAAAELELTLEAAEAAMLDSIPAAQLEAIIANTKVPEETRRKLLGNLTKATLAALGAGGLAAAICLPTLGHTARTLGIQPDHPSSEDASQDRPQTAGIRPHVATTSPEVDVPNQPPPEKNHMVSRGIRPDRPPATQGE